jgi:uncharacterized protein
MVLSLKAWESRSLPGLPRTERFILFTFSESKAPRETAGLFCFALQSLKTNLIAASNQGESRPGSQAITIQIVVILAGALAGGFVNGLTGFGAGLTAMGLWLYAISPPIAASLVIVCSVISQLQTLPMIWHAVEWRLLLPFIVPGLVGVPIGTVLVAHIDPQMFKIGVGLCLVCYAAYAVARKAPVSGAWGGRVADGAVGFGGGVLGGLAGLSGLPIVVWTDIRGYGKEYRRSVLQTFNLSILAAALVSHAYSGLLTRQVGLAAVAAAPATICGAWLGAAIYKRLGDSDFRQIVMALLFLSGVMLIWTSR